MQYPDATVQSQYAASPTIRALVDGFNAEIDPRSDIQLFYDKIFNPATAQGVGLDYWARIVGVERNIFVEDLSQNFGFFVSGGSSTATYSVPSAIQSLPGYGWSAGEVYNYVDFGRKVYVQRVESVDLGTLTWQKSPASGTTKRFYSTGLASVIKPTVAKSTPANAICAKYATASFDDVDAQTTDKIISVGAGGSAAQTNVQIYDTSTLSMTNDEFKTAMSGVMFYYELDTPIETDISEYLTSLPVLPVEPDTPISFPNSNGDGYHIPVPAEIRYQEGEPQEVTDDSVAYAKTVDVQGYVDIDAVGGRTVVDSGALVSAGVTSIVCANVDSVTLDTYTIPAEVQALSGYGWSAGSAYNEVDFERKVYVRRVGGIDLGVLSWHLGTSGDLRVFDTYGSENASLWEAAGGNPQYTNSASGISNLICVEYQSVSRDDIAAHIKGIATRNSSGVGRVRICDPAKDEMTAAEFKASLSGVILYYELATPIETDISAYLTTPSRVYADSGSTLTFVNTNVLPVPSTISYTIGDIVKRSDAYAEQIGDATSDVTVNVVGGKTIVWNQLVIDGNFTNASNWYSSRGVISVSGGVLSCTGTSTTYVEVRKRNAQGVTTVAGHQYLLFVKVSSSSGKIRVEPLGTDSTFFWESDEATTPVFASLIFGAESSVLSTLLVRALPATSGVSETITLTLENYCLFDLTAMFGADNEPATVEEFRAMFPEDFYAYDAGSLLSAGVTGIKYARNAAASQDWQPWDQGVFFNPDMVKRGTYRIDDTSFRQFIFWKALANISTTDCYTLNRLLSKLFNSPVIVTETGVMQIRITMTRRLEDWQKAVLMQYGLFGKPAGVGYEFWTIETPVLGFVLDGDNYHPFGQAPIFAGTMEREIGG